MATNNTYLDEVKDILKSLKAEKAVVLAGKSKDGKELSENTVHTKTYNLNREIKFFSVINGLLGIVSKEHLDILMKKDKVFADSLLSLINPSNGGVKIVINEGDKLLALVKTFPNASVTKLTERAEKSGLKLGSDGNTFVKA